MILDHFLWEIGSSCYRSTSCVGSRKSMNLSKRKMIKMENKNKIIKIKSRVLKNYSRTYLFSGNKQEPLNLQKKLQRRMNKIKEIRTSIYKTNNC